MQAMFYGAFQGEKRDIRALLNKFEEGCCNQDDTKKLTFHDVELPDNWEEMDEAEWVKIQFAIGGTMTVNYLEGGLFRELGTYMLHVEGFTRVISKDYGYCTTYTYSPYGSLEIFHPDTKREAQDASKEFERKTGYESVTRVELHLTSGRDYTDLVTPAMLETLIEQDDVANFVLAEPFAPELWDWLPNLLHCAHICGAVKMEAHLNELEQTGLAAGKKRKPLTVAQWKKLWALSDNKDGTYTVTGYKGAFSHVIVPEMVGRHKVVKIEHLYGIKTLTIPTGVTYLALKRGIKDLERIEVSENNQQYSSYDGVLFNKAGDTLLCCPSQKDTLENFSIPEGVTKIGERAFEGCLSLESITIPESVTEIGECAFEGCSNLKSITIPESVTEIGEGAFWGCSSLKSTASSDSVTEIAEKVFGGCDDLPINKPVASYAEQYEKQDKSETETGTTSAMKNMSYSEMVEELEMYYEAAGFDSYYERELKGQSESAIREMYQRTFGDLDMSGAE